MLVISSYHSVIPDGVFGTAPEWLHLIPSGTFKGRDGRGPFVLKNPAGVIANSMANGHPALDENHSTDLAAPRGEPSPAQGWIEELQAREDGIWGRIEWNESGRQLMARKAYRAISPVFQSNADTGEVLMLLRASLTNTPNLGDLKTLHTQQETGLDLVKLRKALGLPDTADEAAILLAATTAHTAVTAHAAQIKAIATAAGADAADADGLVTVLAARQAAATDVQAMAQKVVTLETELSTMKKTSAHAAAVAFVDAQIAAGKPINALREHYITRHAADPVAVQTELNGLVSINAGGMARKTGAHDEGGEDALSQEEMAVCEKMGQDPKKFAEHKKLMASKKKGA